MCGIHESSITQVVADYEQHAVMHGAHLVQEVIQALRYILWTRVQRDAPCQCKNNWPSGSASCFLRHVRTSATGNGAACSAECLRAPVGTALCSVERLRLRVRKIVTNFHCTITPPLTNAIRRPYLRKAVQYDLRTVAVSEGGGVASLSDSACFRFPLVR